MKRIKLGVNIDHIATLRNARGENDPSLLEILFAVQDTNVDSITMHLREDRRHIQDNDIFEVKRHSKLPINLEMAVNEEILKIALKLKPKYVCLVPEKREEVTTEGGLDLTKNKESLVNTINTLREKNIEVFLFVEPDIKTIKIASEINATGVEIHTGSYARKYFNQNDFNIEFNKIKKTAKLCTKLNLEFHAGHGLNYFNVEKILSIKTLTEVNIGHSIIARALKVGIKKAIEEMILKITRK